MIGIRDPDIAFAFDVECEEILFQSELDREARQFETLTGQAISGALGGSNPAPTVGTNHVERRW